VDIRILPRLRKLILHLDRREWRVPPQNVGLKTALQARSAGLADLDGDFKSGVSCRLTELGFDLQKKLASAEAVSRRRSAVSRRSD